MDKFLSFFDLITAFGERESPALLFADPNVRSISFRELRDRILAYANTVRSSGSCAVEIIICDHTPETVIRIFGEVIVGHGVILADPSVPEDLLRKTKEAALLRMRKKEQAGRGASEEGELFFFTSGTTSRSKAAVLTSRSLCLSAWSGQSMLPCGPDDVLLSVLPLSHVFGFVCSLLWGIAYGAAVALGRGVRHLMDDTLLFHPTILPAVPSLISAMAAHGALNEELRIALIGAAPCPSGLVRTLQEKGISVFLGYGLTETSSGVAITQDPGDPYALYPCPGAGIRIEPDGEISVATPCLMEGYLVEGASEGEGAVDTPLRDGRFFTGDFGSLDEEGRLHVSGRKKDVLVLPDGTKIYCPEYEEALSKLLGTPEIAVILQNGHAAAVYPSSVDPDEAARAATSFNANLPRSQQIYDMIASDRPLPRTATGKLRRWALAGLQ